MDTDKVTIYMKTPYRLLLVSILLATTITGCAMFGSNPSPPTKAEQKLFDIVTNVVKQVVTETNVVQRVETNYQVVAYTITNQINQLVPVNFTNVIPVVLFSTNIVTRTNDVEQYTYGKPNATAQGTAGVIGGLTNVVAPGAGSLVTELLLGAAAIWGGLRSTKANKVNGVLTQTVETAREVLKTTSQGQVLDERLMSWMKDHHLDEGVITQIAALVDKNVDTGQAKEVAAVIANKPATV